MEILHSHQYCIHNWCLNSKRLIQVLLLKNIYLWNHLYNHICTYFHHPSIGLHWDMDCFHSHLYCTGSWYPQSPSHNYRCSYLSHLDICHVCHRVDQHSHQCWCHSFFLFKKQVKILYVHKPLFWKYWIYYQWILVCSHTCIQRVMFDICPHFYMDYNCCYIHWSWSHIVVHCNLNMKKFM